MVPTMLHLERFAVMGVVAPISMGSESTEQLGAIWSGFEARRAEIEPYSADRCYYGISFGPETTTRPCSSIFRFYLPREEQMRRVDPLVSPKL